MRFGFKASSPIFSWCAASAASWTSTRASSKLSSAATIDSHCCCEVDGEGSCDGGGDGGGCDGGGNGGGCDGGDDGASSGVSAAVVVVRWVDAIIFDASRTSAVRESDSERAFSSAVVKKLSTSVTTPPPNSFHQY